MTVPAVDVALRPPNGWWKDYAERVPGGYLELMAAEEDASRIVHFHPVFVPGLLQTESYAAMITPRTTLKSLSTEDIAVLVEVRMARQRLAFDQHRRKELVFLLDESALHRPVGTPEVMREQLARLSTLARHPAVTLVVLPFHGRAHPGLLGAFTLMAYRGGPADVLCFEWQLGNTLIRNQPELTRRYRDLADGLLATDPDGAHARQLIAAALQRVGSE